MKEDFLHYIWQYKKFDISDLKTVRGENLEVINTGQYLQLAGPDFFNGRIVVNGQVWAGNIEIHLKSSDWYIHHHETDTAYDNVILHVVWEHDTDIYRKNNAEIPVLEIRHYIAQHTIDKYNALADVKSWIHCEKQIAGINSFVLENWKERLFFERLQRKAAPITELATQNTNDWEAVLFCTLAKNFGLNTNGNVFYKIAQSIPFNIVRKESFEAESLEALLMGRAGLLQADKEDVYYKNLQERYKYICIKHRLEEVYIDNVEFFRHRPDNFPTIRLSQLAQLYHTHQNLFSKLTGSVTLESICKIFSVQTLPYWQAHYQFDRESPKKRKALTKSFIDLLIINTILPFRFAYAQSIGRDNSEEIIEMLAQIAPEKNSIIDKFKSFAIESKSAYDTQALLQLKNEYCTHKKCMQCAVGLELLKN